MNNATDIRRTPASWGPWERFWPFRSASGSPPPGQRLPFAGLSASLKRRRQHQALADIGVTREERARELARYLSTIL